MKMCGYCMEKEAKFKLTNLTIEVDSWYCSVECLYHRIGEYLKDKEE